MNKFSFNTDVLIVGGGPAGAAAALSFLAYSDLKVMVIDNSAFDVVKVGENINPSLFELLSYLKIDRNLISTNEFIHTYDSFSAWGSEHLTPRHAIFNAQEANCQLDREKFDFMLLSEAAQKGATIIPRVKCKEFKQTEDGNWEITANHFDKGDFSIKTKFLIDATGRQGHVCRKIGINAHKIDQLTAVGVFLNFNQSKNLRQETMLETAPDGWWYCATLPNQKMVISLFTDADILKEKQLQKPMHWHALLLQTKHIKTHLSGVTEIEKPWVRNAFSQITNFTTHKNFLAIGDAAASFDPLSSLGIGFAISSACHAAKAVTKNLTGDEAAIIAYQRNIEENFNNYFTRRLQFYQKEKRWLDAPFWQRRMETN